MEIPVETLTLATVIVSSVPISLASTRAWVRFSFRHRELLSRDLHKRGEVLAAKVGGFPVALLLIIYSGVIPRLFNQINPDAAYIAAIYTAMGFVDDFIGLRNWEKIALAALPFALLSEYLEPLPILGEFLPHPLLMALYGAFVVNSFNTLAGFNGLEASLSSVISLSLGIIAVTSGSPVEGSILLATALVCVGFLPVNWYPAKAFPGNILTFLLGGLVGFIAARSGLYIPMAILLIPHAADFFLKLATWGKASQKVPTRLDESGRLIPPPNLSLPGLLIRLGVRDERRLVASILLMELLLASVTLALFVHSPS